MFARAACCDVTPRDRPVQLAGYAARTAPTSIILDPIEISAVLLECDGHRCLIFSFDLMMVGSELQDILLARLAALGFRPDEVILLASHTHSAPATDQACKRLGPPDIKFVNDAAEAAEELVRRIQRERPVRVSMDVFRGRLNHSINRRRYWPFPTFSRTYGFELRSVTFSPNPAGPKDEEGTVILLRDSDNGEPLAGIWHYACHPTAVVPYDVISSDYPGAVRQMLRERLGQIPCLFAQGLCGDVRPNIVPSPQKLSLRERLGRIKRVVAFGILFQTHTPADWITWSRSLAAAVGDIVRSDPVKRLLPDSLRAGSASIPLDRFFTGSIPDKMLTVRMLRIGDELEFVVLSAEVTVEWQRILNDAVPCAPQRLRLYVGYMGPVFGYLPTAAQIPEGGYEVQGFQPLFGLSGQFEADRISAAVVGCVRNAFAEMERAKQPTTAPAQ